MHWWNSRRMVCYISCELDSRFESHRGKNEMAKEDRTKTIIDLALHNYLSQ